MICNTIFNIYLSFTDFRVDFIQLALEYKPLNLGQGLPDDLIPDYAVNALKDVATEPMINNHQYTRGFVSKSVGRNLLVNINTVQDTFKNLISFKILFRVILV